MLSAQDRDQVAKWSQRQLGISARLVSISEKEFCETDGYVEKGGTGIQAMEANGCQPVLSIMANLDQNALNVDEGHLESNAYVNSPSIAGRMLTLH